MDLAFRDAIGKGKTVKRLLGHMEFAQLLKKSPIHHTRSKAALLSVHPCQKDFHPGRNREFCPVRTTADLPRNARNILASLNWTKEAKDVHETRSDLPGYLLVFYSLAY